MRKEPPPSAPSDPKAYVSFMRADMRKHLESISRPKEEALNYDIEQNIREIRAMLARNKDIFDRNKSSLVASTGPELNGRDFDLKSLMELPESLKEIIAVRYKDPPYDRFIDYDSFFQKSLALHEDVLETFLAHLRNHLQKNVQVCLRQLDKWLAETASNKNVADIDKISGGNLDYSQPWGDQVSKEAQVVTSNSKSNHRRHDGADTAADNAASTNPAATRKGSRSKQSLSVTIPPPPPPIIAPVEVDGWPLTPDTPSFAAFLKFLKAPSVPAKVTGKAPENDASSK